MSILVNSGGGGTSQTATSTGDLEVKQEWVKPRFIKSVSVISQNKPYRIKLYTKTDRGWKLIDSKVQNEGLVAHWFFANGLYFERGIKAVGIQVESGDKLTLHFEGVIKP